jgi:hypothetical protein
VAANVSGDPDVSFRAEPGERNALTLSGGGDTVRLVSCEDR